MITVDDIPRVEGAAWVRRAYAFLAQIPPLPSVSSSPSIDRELAFHIRMYSAHEVRVWVASNLMWFEEGLELLSDARLALTSAVKEYGDGFPLPATDGLPAMPGVFLQNQAPPSYDLATVRRARLFRYHIDDAVIRISATFEKIPGLLGSYYSIQFRDKAELFSELMKRCPEAPLLSRMREIVGSQAFQEGQRYRNPRIHSLGASFRALYGGRAEIFETLVMSPGCVFIKTRLTVTADQLFELAKAFYGAALDFMRAGVGLVQAHPRRFTRENPFVARRIQKPILHRGVDENKMPVDWTDEFSTDDERIWCTALVHSAKGRKVRVRWHLGGRTESSQDTAVEDDRELKVTCWIGPDAGRKLRPGPGSVEWWLDGELLWKVRFRVVESA
jgi:hypothetical protein